MSGAIEKILDQYEHPDEWEDRNGVSLASTITSARAELAELRRLQGIALCALAEPEDPQAGCSVVDALKADNARLREALDIIICNLKESEGHAEVSGGRYDPIPLTRARETAEAALSSSTAGAFVSLADDLSPEELDDACMWYRHDFGLLDEDEKRATRHLIREAWLAIRKARKLATARGS